MSSPGEYNPLKAVLWMMLTGFCFIGVQATVKHLGPGIPPAESAFLRYVLGLVFLIPMWPELRRMRLSRRALALFTLRGAAQAVFEIVDAKVLGESLRGLIQRLHTGLVARDWAAVNAVGV